MTHAATPPAPRASGAAAGEALSELDRLASEEGIALAADAPIGPLTTLRVGGAADRLATPRTRAELLTCLEIAATARVPVFPLGNGSDVVVADAGIRGLVIRNRSRDVVVDGTTLSADSGAAMAMLVRRAATEGLAGFEFGISIPGTLGGAVWANAGAHDGEMAQVVTAVEIHDPASGERRRLAGTECRFAYRESRFKHSPEVVLGATLQLRPGDRAAIEDRVAEHQAARQATQPLADQNAGSVFRNPPGDYAGRLIEAAGLKGRSVGGASVSEKHANFIVTAAGARAADVRALGDLVRQTVADRFGVELQYEIEFVGEWPA